MVRIINGVVVPDQDDDEPLMKAEEGSASPPAPTSQSSRPTAPQAAPYRVSTAPSRPISSAVPRSTAPSRFSNPSSSQPSQQSSSSGSLFSGETSILGRPTKPLYILLVGLAFMLLLGMPGIVVFGTLCLLAYLFNRGEQQPATQSSQPSGSRGGVHTIWGSGDQSRPSGGRTLGGGGSGSGNVRTIGDLPKSAGG